MGADCGVPLSDTLKELTGLNEPMLLQSQALLMCCGWRAALENMLPLGFF